MRFDTIPTALDRRYRTLRQGKEMGHPVIADIAARLGKTPAQVLGRWCVQQNIVYIPKSEKRERMVENAQVRLAQSHACLITARLC
jgi:diketogulonate reductase-like aldo/keto reductase